MKPVSTESFLIGLLLGLILGWALAEHYYVSHGATLLSR